MGDTICDSLLDRVRGEYREMPGLQLTIAQACRLWQIDRATCEAVLQELIRDEFLLQTLNGSYIARPMAGRSIKASFERPGFVRRGA
jgi:hypothetical protein